MNHRALWHISLFALLAACSGDLAHENAFDPETSLSKQARATLSGKVTLEQGGDPRQATVSVRYPDGQAEVTPEADGTFVLAGIPPGARTLAVDAPYFERVERELILEIGEARELEPIAIRLKRVAVRGSVSVESSGAVALSPAGAAVSLRQTKPVVKKAGVTAHAEATEDTTASYSTTVQSDGTYSIEGVTPGVYEATAGTAEAGSEPVEATVEGDGTVTVEPLVLKPLTGDFSLVAGAHSASRSVQLTLLGFNADQVQVGEERGGVCAYDGAAVTYAVQYTYLLDDFDGEHVVCVRYLDEAGRKTADYRRVVYLDRVAPLVASVGFVEGAYSADRFVTLALDVAEADQMKVTDAVNPLGNWVAYSPRPAYTIPPGADGAKQAWVTFRDQAGNEAGPIEALIILDTAAPAVAGLQAMTINGMANPVTNSAVVGLTFSVVGAVEMRISENAQFNDTLWMPYSASRTFVLSQGSGAKTIFAEFRDAAGNVLADQRSVTLDTRAITSPYVNVVEAVTSATTVTIEASAGDLSFSGSVEMMLSERSDFSGASWFAYQPFTTYTVGGADGLKTVYAKFRKLSGTTSAVVSDTFTLDRVGPNFTSVTVNNGAAYAASLQVALGLIASDAVSGVESMLVSEDPAFAGAVRQPYTLTLAYPFLADGPKTVYVRYFDRAGNASAAVSTAVVVDTLPPTLSLFQVEDGTGNAVATTNRSRVTVRVDAADVNPLQMLVSNRSDFAGSAWQPYQDHLLWDLPLPSNPLGEPRTVYVKLRDAAGNTVPGTPYGFVLDTIAPSGVGVDIAGAATTSPTVTVSFSFVNADTIEIAPDIGFQNKTAFSARAATTYTFSPGEGVKTLFARFKDAAGNLSEIVADSINLDAAPPQLADFTIEEGAATNQPTVHLKLTAIDAVEMQISENACGGAWVPFAMSYAYAFTSAADGVKTIAVRYRDTALNETGCIVKTIALDQAAPAPMSLVIEGGTAFVTNRNVGVALAATGATEFQISESIVFTGATWIPFATQFSWTLSAGEGPKTLYVRFRDAAGNVSGTLFDDVSVDTTVPSFNALSAPGVTSSTAVPLQLTATGAFEMRLSSDPTFAAAPWEAFDPAPTFTVAGTGARTIYVQLRDGAGNESIVRSVVVTVDQTAPGQPAISLLGGAYTKSAAVSLQVLASDSAEMRVSQLASMSDAVWQPYSQLKAFVLAGGEGPQTVFVRVRDAAGNVSPQAALNVVLDQTAPQVTSFTARDGNGVAITSTNQLRFYVALAVTDASPLTVQFSPTNVFSGVPVEAPQPLRPWDTAVPVNPAGETRTVYARVADAAGNEFTAGPLSVLVDTLGPTGPGIVLSASLVSAPTVGVTLSASSADFAELSADIGFISPVRFAYQAVTSYALPGGDGAKTVYARFADAHGNYSPIVASSVTLDQTPPQAAGFSIDQGALTNLTSINLSLSAVDAVEMQIAENACGGLWVPYQPAAAHAFDSIAEGVKTLAVRFRDAAGNRSACITKSIVLDRSAPTFTSGTPVIINGDATSTTERAVTLSFAVTDATEMLVSENPSYVGAVWIPFSATYGWVLSAGEGTKTVFAKFRDAAKNETVGMSDAIAYVIATPSVSILNGSVTNNRTVQVQILVNNAVEVLLSELPAMTGAVWQSFSNVKSFQLADNDGTHTVYVRTRDALGNISGQAAASILLDRTAPYFTVGFLPITINNDATSTTDRAVTLSFAVTQATEMIVSEDPGFTGANWVPFSASSAWVLSAGDGAKTLYAKFRDAAGNQTAVVNDSIFIAPSTPSVTILGGAFTRFTNVSVQILSSNATEVLISQYAPMTDATWQPYAAVKSFALAGADGLKVVYVRVRDGVGNVSGQAQATVTLDRVAPNISYFAPADAFGAVIGYSTQTRYFLAVTATDLSEPMTVQFSSYNGFIGATPFEFISNTLYPWDAEPAADSAGEVRSTYMKLVDAAGNVGYAGPVTVLVDNVGVEQSGSTIAVSPNPTSSPTVTVALSSMSAASVELSEDPLFISPPPVLFAMRPSTTYTFASGDGLKTLWARFRDSGGFPENAVSDTTVLDTAYPQNVTFTIDEGSVAATLTVHIRSGTLEASEMQISDAACGSGTWVAFEGVKAFTFTSGINGPRSIYVRYRDQVNHQSACVAQPILLDTSRANITSISPSSGAVGSVVTISGANIGQAIGSVTIGGVPAEILSWSDTAILARVPTALAGGPSTVVVVVDGNPSPSFPFEVLPGITAVAPMLTYVGQSVHLTGGAFGATQGASTLSVGGISPAVTSWTANGIDFVVPAGIGAKSQQVYVVVNGRQSNVVSILVAPHIGALSPATGPSNTVVTATGSNFGFTQGTSKLRVNSAVVPVLSWSNTSIAFEITPEMSAGFLGIDVVLGSLSSVPVYFEHTRPWIDLSYPNNVTSGETLWLIGRYFENTAGQVWIGGIAAPVSSWTSGAVAVTIPAGAVTGTTSVWLETASAVSSNTRPLFVRKSDQWLGMDSPLGRETHTLVWSGSEMLVFGGQGNNGEVTDGWRYNPATDTWAKMSSAGEPGPRQYHTAVWTGQEMIVWGGDGPSGYTNTGGIYEPATDSWRPMSTVNAPTPRDGHSAVWTGTDMIVFGGEDNVTWTGVNSGGVYNLATDSWTPTSLVGAPMGRWRGLAVWTGGLMVVYGGEDNINWDPMDGGARYNPQTDTWAPMSMTNGPGPRDYFSMVWSGSEVLVYGGYDLNWDESNTGGRYNPNTDSWTIMSNPGSLQRRAEHVTVWSGTEMIVWGGCTWSWGCDDQSGERYNPLTDSWTPISPYLPNVPNGRYASDAVWTGSEMIVFGGYYGGYRADGGRYHPTLDRWVGIGFGNPPSPRMESSAVWTGSEMLIWSGNDASSSGDTCYGTYDGHRFDPATNRWRPMAQNPWSPTRNNHSTVWTGNEMIVWGGYSRWCSWTYQADGFRYAPATDTWQNIPPAILSARSNHTAVWTGSKMLVWGGTNGGYLSDGAAFDPTDGTWVALPTINAPTARYLHTAVWTGDEMIVFGGYGYAPACCNYLGTGARYSPAANTWYTLPVTNAPSARQMHTANWTGSEMIVWGGSNAGILGDGAMYRPASNQWFPVPATLASSPTARRTHSAVWTGQHLLVWGGDPGGTGVTDTGALLDPATLIWRPVSMANAPMARRKHMAVWTGREMIIWGGAYNSSENKTNTGAKYYPY